MGIISIVLTIISAILLFTPIKYFCLIPGILAIIVSMIAIGKGSKSIILARIGFGIAILIILSLILTEVFVKEEIGEENKKKDRQYGLSINVIDKSQIKIENIGYTEDKSLLVKVTNNNDVPVIFKNIKVTFKDIGGEILEEANIENQNLYVPANSSVISYFLAYWEKDFSKYIYYEFDYEIQENREAYYDIADFEGKGEKVESGVVFTIKNNAEDDCSGLEINVVYRKEGEIIGIKTAEYNAEKKDLLQGETALLKAGNPTNKEGEELEYDSYEVFLIRAIAKAEEKGSYYIYTDENGEEKIIY